MSYTQNPSIKGVGEMTEYGNAVVIGVAQVNTYNPVHTVGVVAGELDGFTFLAGTDGTYTSIANAGGGQITVNTTGAHGMVAGQVVVLTSATDVGYQPPNPTWFVIQSVTATSFNVIAVFTNTATGTYDRGSCLIAGPDAAGWYKLTWDVTVKPTGSGKDFKVAPFQNETLLTKGAQEAILSIATGAACLASSLVLSVDAGDVLTIGIANTTDATDVTVRNLELCLVRYRTP
jgi:hypothetical protein